MVIQLLALLSHSKNPLALVFLCGICIFSHLGYSGFWFTLVLWLQPTVQKQANYVNW